MLEYLKEFSTSDFQLWAFIAGLGIFLFGMAQLEDGLKALAGRPMKLFLRKQTEKSGKGILAGTLSTAILQSSSVVSLMVLAFVGAGVLQMRNALGIIFGSNLGTTFTGWVVATLGFKMNVEALALPLIGVGSLGVLFFSDQRKQANYFKLVIGFGFLLFGLHFMKQSMEQVSAALNVELLKDLPPVLFLLAGMIFTAIIQSSSATMMITLSALSTGVIDLYSAAALVIGADLGTTGTVLLGAAKGSAEKKQVATAHFLFNLVTDILAFLLLPLLLYLLTSLLRIEDPLFTLVAFHSSFNLMGILIFVPFIDRFAKFLEPRFHSSRDNVSLFLNIEEVSDAETAIIPLKKESHRLMDGVLSFNCRTLKITCPVSNGDLDFGDNDQVMAKRNYSEQYELLKALEGEVLSYVMKVQQKKMGIEQGETLQDFLSSIRNMVAAAKCLKDIRHNLIDFRHSSRDQINNYYLFLSHFMETFYQALDKLWELPTDKVTDLIYSLQQRNEQFHNEFLKRIYADIGRDPVLGVDLSTLLNVNRELFTSNRNLLEACSGIFQDKDRKE